MSSADSCFADRAWHGAVQVAENVRIARDTYRLRFECPQIAGKIVPGQFLMLRLAGCDDPLLGRPLALYDTVLDASGTAMAIDVVYLVKGKLTTRLARCVAGSELNVWGPLGNGFAIQPCDHLVMVAGGIGQTPFLALARETTKTKKGSGFNCPRITLCYGARNREFFAGVEDFQRLGVEVQLATDDGSAGHHGFVTELLARLLATSSRGIQVVCCGPEPMMASAAALCAQADVPCQVSLESPMACGIGICFSCVAKVRDREGGWDYRRTCIEGPVFDARQIVF